MLDDHHYRSVQNEDGSIVTRREWTWWKKVKVFCCSGFLLLAVGIILLVIAGVKTRNCWVENSPSTYDATAAGPNGWFLFVPNNVETMANAKVNIRISSTEVGNGIESDAPSNVSWSNGMATASGTSNAYGVYSSNISVLMFSSGDLNVDSSVLFWCSNCTIYGPNNQCSQNIVNRWILYQFAFTISLSSEVPIEIAPWSGMIKLQGVFV